MMTMVVHFAHGMVASTSVAIVREADFVAVESGWSRFDGSGRDLPPEARPCTAAHPHFASFQFWPTPRSTFNGTRMG